MTPYRDADVASRASIEGRSPFFAMSCAMVATK